MLTKADYPKVSQRQLHMQHRMLDEIHLTTVRVSIEIVSEEQLRSEEKLDQTLWKAGIEMPDDGIIRHDIKLPLTDPGIVQFQKEIANLCSDFQNTKWY